jgi:hypothetical protein
MPGKTISVTTESEPVVYFVLAVHSSPLFVVVTVMGLVFPLPFPLALPWTGVNVVEEVSEFCFELPLHWTLKHVCTLY